MDSVKNDDLNDREFIKSFLDNISLGVAIYD